MKVSVIEIPALDLAQAHQIHFEGSLSVSEIESIKHTVLSALQQYSTINIQLRNIVTLDLAVLQMLFALRSAAKTEDKKIHLEMHLSEELQSIVRQSGLEQKFNYKAS